MIGVKKKCIIGMCKIPTSLSVQNFGRKCSLAAELWCKMFCIEPMGESAHSYVGSTSVLPDDDDYDAFPDQKCLF